VAVISGLLLATILTLVVVPVIYTLLSGRGSVLAADQVRETGPTGILRVMTGRPNTVVGVDSGPGDA
jgi:hypothetical protein